MLGELRLYPSWCRRQLVALPALHPHPVRRTVLARHGRASLNVILARIGTVAWRLLYNVAVPDSGGGRVGRRILVSFDGVLIDVVWIRLRCSIFQLCYNFSSRGGICPGIARRGSVTGQGAPARCRFAESDHARVDFAVTETARHFLLEEVPGVAGPPQADRIRSSPPTPAVPTTLQVHDQPAFAGSVPASRFADHMGDEWFDLVPLHVAELLGSLGETDV